MIDTATGFTKYNQVQANATLTGAEADMNIAISEQVVIHGGFDLVLGRNEETNKWLPMIPARRIKTGIRWISQAVGILLNPYIGINSTVVSNQDRVDKFELATGGYTLVDIGFGAEAMTGLRKIRVDVGVENLFDRAYFDHLSRYKDYGLNPGRNVTLKVTVPFTIVQ